jgi:CheY-like chemotaxis protein
VITILVVGPVGMEASAFAQRHPSVEILTASGAEDALEKLARNRRIDAVLLLPGASAREVAETLREEDPAAPPLFAAASATHVPGVRLLPSEDAERLLELLTQALASEA